MFGKQPGVLVPEYESIFYSLGSSKWDVWKAAGRQAYADSPSISFLFDPENLRYLSDLELGDIQQMAAAGRFDKPRITKEEFEEKYGNTRLKYDPNFTVDKIEDILSQDKQREINEYIISRGKGGLAQAMCKFGVEVIAGNLSPINIAASFVPIGRAAWWAASSIKYGALKTTLAKGFVSGVTGQAAIEPFLYKERNHEQREYELKDSFINILQSGLFGSTLHGLGYGAKILRDKYFITPETLADHIKTNNIIADSEFKINLESVLSEPDPRQLFFDFYKDYPVFKLSELQTAKLELIKQAEVNCPEYFSQYKKVAELEQSLHEQYKTNNNINTLPKEIRKQLQLEKDKLQNLRKQHINNVEFQEYSNENTKLDNSIANILRQEQFENMAYDLSPEGIYTARSQINDGKHINLDNPHNAESIYENIAVQYEFSFDSTKNSFSVEQQVVSLEHEVSSLPENYKAEYSNTLATEQQIETIFTEVISKIKNGVAGKI
ncbi:MAG TPA: hypothetical protein LFW21_01775 [Rickettsia endosymbiont of Pyrocoelia pectoralis]|nr:hypothetical protein [Rickettsia endosymbiont of Pyrocoelia pectoralis]